MTKVLIATEKPFATSAVKGISEIIEQAGFELHLLEKYTDRQQLLDAVKDIDAMIVRSDKIGEDVFAAAKDLKIIVRAGAGVDSIDLEAATRHNVIVENTPGQNANAVAELVAGMLLFNVRNRFNGKSGSELKGRKLGLQAFGNVARNVARVAQGLGMEVYAYDAYAHNMFEFGVTECKSVEDLYSTCDIISLHIPATPETINSINYDLLSRMPQGAILVNTARKEVIDEESTLRFLLEREDASYITDIKPDMDSVYQEKLADRYFSTPKKMGAQTAEANTNAGLAAARQIVDFIKNGGDTFRVN